MRLHPSDLPGFVSQSDVFGGPGNPQCEEFWTDVQYIPKTTIDQSLDPFGDAYVSQQVALYEEISGRALDQSSNEHTNLNVDHHVAATNPYDHGSPGGLAQHIERLSRAIRIGAPRRGGKLLDMGCGWGLSSEIAAYSGVSVTAVDINPDFVSLVNQRAKRLGSNITAIHGAFDTFESIERFDMVLFYECFHHCLRPWDLLTRMSRHLEPSGKIVLAGEPINDICWNDWGLRLDPLSVYCIHKFGWLESGWSSGFLEKCFARSGLDIQFFPHSDGEIGPLVLGTPRRLGTTLANEIFAAWKHEGWDFGAGYMVTGEDSQIVLPMTPGSRLAIIGFWNFRGRPITIRLTDSNGFFMQKALPPGQTDLQINVDATERRMFLHCETWIPNEEIGNGDIRRIGVHLASVSFL